MRKLTRWFLLALLIINFCYVFSGALHLSWHSEDVVGFWLLKAKAIYLENGFPIHTLKNPDFLLGHPHYPILLPFLFSLEYRVVGGINEMAVFLLYPFVYLFILFVCYKSLRKLSLPPLFSLLMTYVYSMLSPLLTQAGREQAGSADIVIVLFVWLLIHELLGKKRLWILLSIVLMASQIKLEGVFLVIPILLLPGSKWARTWIFIAAIAPVVAWKYLLLSLQIPTDFTLQWMGVEESAHRLFLTIQYTLKEMLNFKNWYILWPLFWLSVPLVKTQNSFIRRFAWPTLSVLFLLFIGVYLTATLEPAGYISSSIDRVLFQLSPWVWVIFSWNIFQIFKSLALSFLRRQESSQ
ncbi:MAG TPA: hypothetical protein VLH19_02730 [Patescibacteria group bacterium]|nr:hypothetical protein [Patescibacteria group bacterium]